MNLFKYAGTVTLVVNVASLDNVKTKINYQQLSDLHKKYHSAGFSVLAFPTNDFKQEMGSNEAIKEYLSKFFPDVSFPVFALSSLKDNPVFQELSRQMPYEDVKNNFYKYLVDRSGNAVAIFPMSEDPIRIEKPIAQLLASAGGTTS